MIRLRTIALAGVAGVGLVALAIVRHRGAGGGHDVPGGVVMNDAVGYDTVSRLLLGSLFDGIAANVASVIPAGGSVLEIGCGPGHLALRLARDHGLKLTALDLDPAMIARARANAERVPAVAREQLDFVVGDVAALPFDEGSFDAVVSTMSMHHWDEPALGLSEIARVLQPNGRALIWDIGPGGLPFHPHVPDARAHVQDSGLDLVDVAAWRWPWRLRLTRRMEFVPSGRA